MTQCWRAGAGRKALEPLTNLEVAGSQYDKFIETAPREPEPVNIAKGRISNIMISSFFVSYPYYSCSIVKSTSKYVLNNFYKPYVVMTDIIIYY